MGPGSAYGWVAPVFVALVGGGFWAYCLADFARTDEREMRLYSRQVWLLVLVLGNVIGSLYWFFAGRPERR
jgi:hypothetical protein